MLAVEVLLQQLMGKEVNKIINVIFFVIIGFSCAANAEEKQAVAEMIGIEVYRSPSCGCCGKWIQHLKENKFSVKDYVTNDVQLIKDKYGVSAEMSSCHTAIVNGYVVEGHVPAADIIKMITDKPNIAGISVPGMPVGTPGMDMGGKKDAYQVVSFDKDNNYKTFNSYKGN